MGNLSKSERLRKAICGSCLIAAPALLLVGGLLHPTETTDPARQYEIISSSADRWELAHWFITVSMLLMVGAVLGLAHQLHEQRPAEGILGGAVALVGVLALFAVAAAETVVIPELGRSSEAGAAALYERIFEFGSTRWTVLLVAVLLLPVGLVVMSYGLYRAQSRRRGPPAPSASGRCCSRWPCRQARRWCSRSGSRRCSSGWPRSAGRCSARPTNSGSTHRRGAPIWRHDLARITCRAGSAGCGRAPARDSRGRSLDDAGDGEPPLHRGGEVPAIAAGTS